MMYLQMYFRSKLPLPGPFRKSGHSDLAGAHRFCLVLYRYPGCRRVKETLVGGGD